jgi:hypothetical protein
MRLNFAIVMMCALLLGCPGVKVVKNPNDRDKGIRYYRPKPYLLVTPGTETTEVTANSTTTKKTLPSDRTVTIQLVYMPDFNEEYSIHVRSGLGIANVGFKLDQGWNLTEISQELDSNVDDNIKAVAELTRSLGDVFSPTSGGSPGATSGTETRKWVVCATNVPLGYYEAVIGYDSQCGKRLYGWKYVGFMPYMPCPTDGVGQCYHDCRDPQAAVYGLVFEGGVMMFKSLGTIFPNPDYVSVPVETAYSSPSTNPGNFAAELKAGLEAISIIQTNRGVVTIPNGAAVAEELAFIVRFEPSAVVDLKKVADAIAGDDPIQKVAQKYGKKMPSDYSRLVIKNPAEGAPMTPPVRDEEFGRSEELPLPSN